MWRRMLRTLALSLGGIGAAACSQPTGVCTDDLFSRVSPSATTLGVGQRAAASVELRGCGGSRVLADRITWTSEAPAIARVDSVTGVITGVAPGSTRVQPHGDRYGVALTSVAVTVQ